MRSKRVCAFLLAAAMVITGMPTVGIYAEPVEVQAITDAVNVTEDSNDNLFGDSDRETVTTTLDGVEMELPIFYTSEFGHRDSGLTFHNPGETPEEFPTGAEVYSSYDLRDYNLVTSVKNQAAYGTCWAFAATGAVESGMLKRGQASIASLDFAEMAMAYFGYGHVYDRMEPKQFADDSISYDLSKAEEAKEELAESYGVSVSQVELTGWPEIGYMKHGGDPIQSIAGMGHQYGLIEESLAPYPVTDKLGHRELASEVTSALNGGEHFSADRQAYLTQAPMILMKNPELVKQGLLTYGAADVAYYADGACYSSFEDGSSDYGNYCYIGNQYPNHEVLLVGWDDDYSKENFNGDSKPENDGAWILKNSWGTVEGDHPWDGYFYVSYEDTSLKGDKATFYEVNTNTNEIPDNLYQYDGSSVWNNLTIGGDSHYEATVFHVPANAESNQAIREVSYMTDADTEYEIEIYKNPVSENGVVKDPRTGTKIGSVTGRDELAGFHTVAIPCSEILEPGDSYAVVMHKENSSGGNKMYVEQSCIEDWKMTDSASANSIVYADYYGQFVARADIKYGQSLFSENGDTFVDIKDAKEHWHWEKDYGLGDIILHAATDDITTIHVSENQVNIWAGSMCSQKVLDEDDTDYDGTLTYTSSDTKVATVDNSGIALGVHPGTATITAKAEDGAVASYELRVVGDFTKCSIADIGTQQYTGKEIVPEVEVKWQKEILTLGEDYVVLAKNNKDAGTATATISGIGYYEGEAEKSFTISDNKLEVELVHGNSYEYTGENICPEVRVFSNEEEADEDDYDVNYRNNTEVGTAYVTVTLEDTGISMTKTFKIERCKLSSLTIYNIDDQLQKEAGKAVEPGISVYDDGAELVENKDYYVEYSNNTEPRRAYGTDNDPIAIVTGIGNYEGSRKLPFSIICEYKNTGTISIEKAKITNINSYDYTGEPIEQQPRVVLSGNTLTEGVDYYLSYVNEQGYIEHTNAGKITVTIHGIGKYTDEVRKKFTIKPISFASDYVDISLEKYCYRYTGSRIQPVVTVKTKNGIVVDSNDYMVSVAGKGKAGIATAKIIPKKENIGGSGNFTGSKAVKFYITKGSMELQPLSLSVNYTGQAVTLKTLKAVLGKDLELTDMSGNTYKNGGDWKITLAENKKAGTAVVILNGLRGNKGKTGYTTFQINALTPEQLTKTAINPITYKGKAVYPKVTIKNGKKKLAMNKDYKLYYFNNNAVGTGTVSVVYMGNYTGTENLDFTIK